MRLDTLLQGAGLAVERPPRLWDADTDEAQLRVLLDAMIAAARGGAAADSRLVLNVSNVVVEPATDRDEDEEPEPRPGEYVAVTVSGSTDLGPDSRWPPRRPERPSALLESLQALFPPARVPFAYVRRIAPAGSVTVFLPRAGTG